MKGGWGVNKKWLKAYRYFVNGIGAVAGAGSGEKKTRCR